MCVQVSLQLMLCNFCYRVNQIPNCWCPHVVCGLCFTLRPSHRERQSKTTPSSHLVLFPGVGSRDEERLVRDLFRGYNKLIRPVENMTQKVEVAFGLAFIQLINVVSISSSSFSSFTMIPLMKGVNGHFLADPSPIFALSCLSASGFVKVVTWICQN